MALDENDKKLIMEMIENKSKKDFNKRIGDTPTDDLQLTPRKYVNMNGTITNRPSVATIGQQYFATDLNKPIFYNGTNWRDSTSSVVAS